MSEGAPPLAWSARAYLVFLAVATAALVLLAGIAVLLAGGRDDGSLPALLAALAVVGLASAVSGIIITFSGGTPSAMFVRTVLATLVRLVLVAGLGAVCVLVLGLAKGPFLIGLVVAYLALLAIDTAFSVRATPKPRASL